jgi:(4-(4-[2-(gamma-L-glutamylamino)ethyl]phenoxymethyl)furan-2-yl)methanamine synthase
MEHRAEMKRVLGLDIGGANLKLANTDGTARTVPFELWKRPEMLPAALSELLACAPRSDQVAVTMTGELCDCFETKRHGVNAILDAVEATCSGPSPLIWRNDGQFVDIADGRQSPYQIAAANWLALATFAGRFVDRGAALLIDIGSTTTDIIPILDGKPIPKGRTDPERLLTGELVYRGVRRTPICCNRQSNIAAELFATTLDAFLVLNKIPENTEDRSTADGRSASKFFGHARLARMLGADGETCPDAATLQLARQTVAGLVDEIGQAIQRVANGLPTRPTAVILAGSGEFFGREIVEQQAWMRPCLQVSLTARLGPALSSAGCAYAVAVLAAERDDGN